MIKSLFVGRRAPGISRAACHAHLRDVHAPMIVCAPPDVGTLPAGYVQNHVFDGAYPAKGSHAIERDLATELWAESLDAMRASSSSAYYLANMRPDEPNFVDDATVAKMRLEPRDVIAGAHGRYKVFVLASRAAGIDETAWAEACTAACDALGAAKGVTALVENGVTFPPTGERLVDVVLEAWLDDADDAAQAVCRADAGLGAFGDAIDRDRSFMLAAEEFPRERLRDIYRQTHA